MALYACVVRHASVNYTAYPRIPPSARLCMRFSIPHDAPLRPYIVTSSMNQPLLVKYVPKDIVWYDALDPKHRAYCLALNRANSFAHDGSPIPGSHATALGMPRWVQLDCCLLPAAMIGFETRRDAIPQTIADALDPTKTLEWIAVSEYVALPSVEPRRHTGISMFSLVQGRSLGVRSKALGLHAVQSVELIGVTQYSNPGVGVHLRFGPLHIVTPSVAVHSRPGETFVYRLDVPSMPTLQKLSTGEQRNVPLDLENEWSIEHRFDPQNPDERAQALAYIAEAPTWVLDAGPVQDEHITWLALGRPR